MANRLSTTIRIIGELIAKVVYGHYIHVSIAINVCCMETSGLVTGICASLSRDQASPARKVAGIDINPNLIKTTSKAKNDFRTIITIQVCQMNIP